MNTLQQGFTDIYRIDSSHKLLGFVSWLNRGGWIGCLGALCFNLANNMCNTSKRGKGEQCKEALILGKKKGYCARLKRWIKKAHILIVRRLKDSRGSFS